MKEEVLETLETGAPRTLATLRPGDRLRSASHESRKQQTVLAVNLSHDGETVRIDTDQGVFEFKPGDRLAFPRRSSGVCVVHRHDDYPPIKEVYVGDVIPPKDGWPEGPTAWRAGLQVTDIQISQKYLGWIVSAKPLDGSPGTKMFVSRKSPMFYSDWWTDDLSTLVPADYRPVSRTTSGRYKNTADTEYEIPDTDETVKPGEVVRFIIAGRPGRRPKNDRIIPAPKEWSEWMLLDMGAAHPEDKRIVR